jgi:shikimate 5-dehydrogenase
LESIFTQALTAPNKSTVITDGRVIGYRDYTAAYVRMRRFMEAQAIERDQVAILCLGELASGWIIGLALRSLGVTTVYARTPEDAERLGFSALTVVSSDVEVWPGLAAAARVGARCIEAPSALYARGATAIALDGARAPTAGDR